LLARVLAAVVPLFKAIHSARCGDLVGKAEGVGALAPREPFDRVVLPRSRHGSRSVEPFDVAGPHADWLCVAVCNDRLACALAGLQLAGKVAVCLRVVLRV